MPRKKLIYTHLFPYHVTARSNNQDWFYTEKVFLWEILSEHALKMRKKYDFLIHAFVLMDNHYHMLASAHQYHSIGKVMCEFQQSVSKAVNKNAHRTNHVFGGPYKASLIQNPEYYSYALRYVYQNPIRAQICKHAESYKFSTLLNEDFAVSSPLTGIASLVPKNNLLEWINQLYEKNTEDEIRRGLRKTIFKPTPLRDY